MKIARLWQRRHALLVPMTIVWILKSLRSDPVARKEHWIEIDHLVSSGFCLITEVSSHDVEKCAGLLFGHFWITKTIHHERNTSRRQTNIVDIPQECIDHLL